ncbi:MAG: ATP-binding protein [Thermodesulfobacteriota bacterium]|nr:ATP-binding protein [Thermodesulfobacteriota bacterium]
MTEKRQVKFNLLKAYRENFGIRVFMIFSIFIFVISASFTAFFIYHQSRSLTENLIHKGKLMAGILAHNSRIGVFSENMDLLKNSIEGAFQQKEVIETSIFNSEGLLLTRRVRFEIQARERLVKESEGELQELSRKLSTLKSPLYTEQKYYFVFLSPVLSTSLYSTEESLFFRNPPSETDVKIIGYVRILVDRMSLNRQINTLLLKSTLIGFVFLMIGFSIIYIAVKGVTRPLDTLTESVKTLGKGENVEIVPVDSKDEIGKLAMAFNDMSQSLKEREFEKQRLEEQLRHAQKMEAIGTLAGGIAHDFNNILGGIMGYIELIAMDAPKGTSLEHNLNEMMKASRRAADMIKQILAFSRQDQKERSPIHIELIVREALRMLRASLPSTIEIHHDIKRDLPSVLSDPTQIHQIMMNLCTNAAHAMRDNNGLLEVSLSKVNIDAATAAQHPDLTSREYMRLTVSDTGCGMEPATIERIFEPYFTTKRPGEGTGMGLAVVHGIVKDNEGAIFVHSEVEEGTTFQIFLPTTERVINEEPVEIEDVPTGNERILFVDDETALVDISQQMLGRFGYEVVTDTSSVEALAIFQADPYKFDLVITDMTMPKMTGAELAKRIMEIRPDMPIILCTGFSEIISEERAKGIGIREFVMKPMIGREMAKLIRNVLDSGLA